MGFFINEHQKFSGNAADLANLASQCAHYLQLPGDLDKINERIVRYYVTEGLVERPARIGRDAQYGYIHLLQFLAGRLLVEKGFPMQKVGPYLMSETQEKLEHLLMTKVMPNMAELLVTSFQNTPAKHRASRVHINYAAAPKSAAIGKATKNAFLESLEQSEKGVQAPLSAINNPLSDSVAYSYDSIGEMADSDQGERTDEQLIALSESIKAGMFDIYKRQEDKAQDLRKQIEQLRYELERTQLDMQKERAQLREQFERSDKERQYEFLKLQDKLDRLLAANTQQNKGKEHE